MPPKKKGGGKKGKAADWGSDDDKVVDPLAAAAAAGSDSDSGAPAPAPTRPAAGKKKKGGGGGGAAAAAAFALLADDGGDDGGATSSDEDEASPPPVAASRPAPAFALPVEGDDDEDEEASPSPPARRAASGFAALGLDDEAADDDDDESEAEPEAAASTGLVAALVLDVAKHPGADKLSVVSLDVGQGPSAPVSVVTNAKEVAPGQVVVLAPAGTTTPGTGVAVRAAAVRGVASDGMLCCGADAGWVDEADGALARLAPGTAPGAPIPVGGPPPGALHGAAALALAAEEKAARKAAKAAAKAAKKSANGSAASLATTAGGGGDADAASLDLAGAKKKKKKAASADVEAALAALAAGGGGDAVAGAPPPADGAAAVAAELAGAKKPKKKASTADVGALLAAIGGGDAGGGDDGGASSKKDKKEKKDKKDKKKKGGSASAEPESAAAAPAPEPTGDDEIDALLASIEAPEPVGGGGGGGGKKKKKKGGAGGGGGAATADADDLDAALAELGIDVPAAPAPAPKAAAEPQATASVDGGGGDDDGDDDGGDGAPKELTAAQKKKLKAKAKAKAAKAARASEGGEGEGGGGGGDAAAVEAAPAPAAAGGKKKGPSAAVRRLQEELERRAAAEAAARAEEEARIAAEEAALAAAEAEAARKAAEAEARKARQKERRAELKKAGLLLTGKAKAEAARLAAVREQFLRAAGGAEGGAEGGADAAPPVKKKAVYEKKKRAAAAAPGGTGGGSAPLSTATSDAAAAAADEAGPHSASPSPPPADEPAEPTPASASEPEEDWDALDPEAVKLLPAAAAAAAAAEERARAAAERERAAAESAAARAALAAAQAEDDGDGSGSDEGGSDGDGDGSESGASSFSSMDTDEELERRVDAQKARRTARFEAARAAADPTRLRAPICCILGHVDTGKTKLLDNVRRTAVQEGEAGGITQQIGATYIPGDAIARRTAVLGARSLGGGGGAQGEEGEAAAAATGADGGALTATAAASGLGLDLALPGLLVIDTPGHESFSNLRSRGSGLCDIAILVVDLMHGLEPQTLESISLLKMRRTPFLIALNKVDRLFGWAPVADAGFRDALAAQADHVRREFADRLAAASLALNEQGLNVAPYWANPDPRKYVNIVPTSAISGEGVPDMLALLVRLTQTRMADRLRFVDEPQATVLEVKVIEGLGTTVDVVLVNGTLREGDTVVACGLHGPLVASVRSLLTPHPLKELRVKGSYVHHKAVQAAQGVKLAAHGLESAVAGTQLLVLGAGDDLDALKAEAMEDMHDIFASVDRTGDGVCAQASTLGSLEALLEFLKSPDVAIPVAGIAIGPVHKRDVMRASIMRERGVPKFSCVLAFDVPVTREAGALADDLGVRVFTADIIYHLFDQFKAYLAQCKADEQAAARAHAAFPCVLKILPTCVFNKKDPIVLGVEVEEGIAAVGTPVCVPSREGGLDLGRIASLELNHKPVDRAHRGDAVAMKIESTCAVESARMFGRHFDASDRIVSRITRRSIDVLKTHFRDDLGRDDWVLVVKLKKLFGIE